MDIEFKGFYKDFSTSRQICILINTPNHITISNVVTLNSEMSKSESPTRKKFTLPGLIFIFLFIFLA